MLKVKSARPGWKVCYLDTQFFLEKLVSGARLCSSLPEFEGQVLVTTAGYTPSESCNAISLSHLVFDLLRQYGDIMAFEMETTSTEQLMFRAEYCSVDAVEVAVKDIRGLKIYVSHSKAITFRDHSRSQTITLDIKPYTSHATMTGHMSEKHFGPLIVGHDDLNLERSFKQMSIQGQGESPSLEDKLMPLSSSKLAVFGDLSPVGRSLTARKAFVGKHRPSPLGKSLANVNGNIMDTHLSPFWSPSYNTAPSASMNASVWSPPFSPGAIGQERGALLPLSASTNSFLTNSSGCSPNSHAFSSNANNYGKSRGRRYHENGQINHNVVDVERIRNGLDVRTTVRLPPLLVRLPAYITLLDHASQHSEQD